MFLDHFVSVFFPHTAMINLVLRLLGRTAAPVFCFFIAQGFHYTSDRKKYTLRLLVLAAISHFPYVLCFGIPFHNSSVVWPLALGLLALMAVKSERLPLWAKPLCVAVACVLSYTSNWYFIAVLWIVGFGIFHGNFKMQILSFAGTGLLHLAWQVRRFGFFHEAFPQWFQLGIFLTIPLLCMYSGKLGKKSPFMTWFFYVFYPAHLILLYVLNRFSPLADLLGR